jgi:hypothetical protein
MHDLPLAIRQQLSLLLNRELVANIPMLRSLDLNTVVGLMQNLNSRIYLPGEFVFHVGWPCEYLYFIKTGVRSPPPGL